MATKSVFPGAIVGRSFILSILFLILVVALFFIPEIIHLQESFFKSGTGAQTASVSSYRVEEQAAEADKSAEPEKQRQLSALDKVLVMLNSGYLESTNKSAVPMPPDGKPASRARLSLSSIIPGQEQTTAQEGAPEEGLSWRTLRNPQVTKVLRKAREDVKLLARGLSPNSYQSRDALLNYQNGIGWLLEGDKTPLPIQSGLDYIERLDLDVTRALIKDRVDRADYIRWSKISLGPVFANSKAARLKQEYLAPYNPRITLVKAKLNVGKQRVTREGMVMTPPTHATIIGFVLGKDTQRLTLFRDNKRIKTISLSKKPDEEGKRIFRFAISPAVGMISIQAVDGMEYIVQKNYRFFPKAAAFNRANRVVQLPFGSIEDTRHFQIREVDLRLDRYFRESVSSYNPNQGGMETGEKYQLVGF